MTDRTLAWAIAEIEKATAETIKSRDYYRAILRNPANAYAESYLLFARRALQTCGGKLYGLEDARAILKQVDEEERASD